MWESRVLRRAFERLELHEGKLSRAVLRGGGGGDVTSLPDTWVGNHPGLPGPDYAKRRTDTGLRAIRSRIILNHAISGLCSTQISSPVSGSFTLRLIMYFLPSAIAIAVAPNSRSSAFSSIWLSMASLIRLPRE